MSRSPAKKAVFPVAGWGTRMLPATKAVTKEMLTVFDRPLIQYAFEEALAAGCEEFVFVTGKNDAALRQHFDRHMELEELLLAKGKHEILQATNGWLNEKIRFTYVEQKEALGLGHAVLCAREAIGDEPFFVLLPDVLLTEPALLQQMNRLYQNSGGNVIAVSEVAPELTKQYGIVSIGAQFDAYMAIDGMVEKPDPLEAPSNLSILGRYLLEPAVFVELEKGRRGAGGEIQLTDAMLALMQTTPFYGVRYEGELYDCGGREGFIQANLAMALRDAEVSPKLHGWMREQVGGGDTMLFDAGIQSEALTGLAA